MIELNIHAMLAVFVEMFPTWKLATFLGCMGAAFVTGAKWLMALDDNEDLPPPISKWALYVVVMLLLLASAQPN